MYYHRRDTIFSSRDGCMANSKSREKFVELAQKRVNRALKDIQLIGNLSNRSNYTYTDEDAQKIYKALKEAVDEMKAKFESRGATGKNEFRL
jgi:hypothetical protein